MLLFTWPSFKYFTIPHIADVVIVLILVLILIRAFKGTPAINIILAMSICAGLFFVANYFDMPMLKNLFSGILNTGIIGLVVLFQPELRKFLISFGKNSPFGKNGILTKLLKTDKANGLIIENDTIDQISKCLVYCIANKLGSLIILLPTKMQEYEVSSGVQINGNVNSKLLESIFEKKSPLHDGAVIIQNNQILAARVVLPLSDDSNLPVRIGLRHRAAIGITESMEVLAIIVSEEKNTMSFAIDGKLHENQTLDKMKAKMYEFLTA
jgi:diadenylate cyclase